jgi:hypothetical protein
MFDESVFLFLLPGVMLGVASPYAVESCGSVQYAGPCKPWVVIAISG